MPRSSVTFVKNDDQQPAQPTHNPSTDPHNARLLAGNFTRAAFYGTGVAVLAIRFAWFSLLGTGSLTVGEFFAITAVSAFGFASVIAVIVYVAAAIFFTWQAQNHTYVQRQNKGNDGKRINEPNMFSKDFVLNRTDGTKEIISRREVKGDTIIPELGWTWAALEWVIKFAGENGTTERVLRRIQLKGAELRRFRKWALDVGIWEKEGYKTGRYRFVRSVDETLMWLRQQVEKRDRDRGF